MGLRSICKTLRKQVKICDFNVSILRINWQIFLKNCDVEIPWIYHLRSGIL